MNGIQPSAVHSSQPASVQALDLGLVNAFKLRDDMTQLDVLTWNHSDDSSTGTNALSTSVAGGVKDVVTAQANDDYHVMYTTAPMFQFGTKALSFAARVLCTVVGTTPDDASLIVGLQSDMTTGGLGTAATGPTAAGFTGAVWYRLEGTTVWAFRSSKATVKTTQTGPTFTTSVWYQLGFDYDPNDGVTAKITPWIKNETTGVLYTYNTQDFVIGSAAMMYAVHGVKSGGAVETLSTDWIDVVQLR